MSELKNIFQNSTILYVEDDEEIMTSISTVIDKIFKKIYMAKDGQEGLELFLKHKDEINIVITDIYMPHMNGLDMMEQIKKENYNVPILIVSAFTDVEYLIKAINYGAEGFLTKPLNMKYLLNQIEKALKIQFYEEELKKKDELMYQQSKFAAMGEMIGNIAHQWRQPLNSIGSIMLQLETKTDMDLLEKDDIYESVKMTNSIVSHMSKTIDDFRNFFKPNKEMINFKFKEVMDNVLSLVLPQLSTHNITLKIECPAELTYLGYQNEFKQVVINIVNNAKDAIIGKNISNGNISLKVIEEENNILIEILDNAGGINESIIDKIFDPYFTTKFKSQGTGVGLYMSKIIIEKNMQGLLTVRNHTDGAVFKIVLPKSSKI